MKTPPSFRLFVVLFLLVSPVHAALISSSDGTYTIDTVSGVEWLDLTYSVGYSRNDVLAAVGSSYGGGWGFASNAQIDDLFMTLFPDNDLNATSRVVYTKPSSAVQHTQVALMNDLFGGGYSGDNVYSWGLFMDENELIRMMGSYSDPRYSIVYSPNVSGGYSGPFSADYSFELTGHYLVRNSSSGASVPVSSPVSMIALSLLGMLGLRRGFWMRRPVVKP